jgi:hypothetical protein
VLTTIHITVRDRVPTITAGEDVISHNSDYVAEFEFDEEWQDKVKTVYFVCEDGSYQAVVMDGNSCGVPMMAGEHRRIFVGVQAGSAEKPSVLKTTRPCCLKVKDSIADYLGEQIPDPTPSVYEQIIAMLESITSPTWDSVQNKPFSTLGGGLEVDENGVLSAQEGGSPNAVQYVAQSLTDEQKTQARNNIDADKKRIVVEASRSSGGSTLVYYNVDDQNAAIDNFIAEYKAGTEILLRLYNRDYPLTNIDEDGIVYFAGYVYDAANKSVGVVTYKMEKNKAVVEESSLYGIRAISLDSQLKYKGYAADAKAVGDALGTKLDKNQGTGNAGKILGVGEDGIVVPQDKPTYTLPQATADALGGIKADAATDEDTQDVRIGADSKLKTKPTGGSSITVDSELSSTSENPVQNKIVTSALAEKITAPTTAAVGQIIKVKSVGGTGKPTEWEAADLPSGGTEKEWTKILEVEVTEATAAFEVTGLDNYTEFLAINSGLQNAASMDSAQNLYINGIQVCVNFVDVPKSGGLAYNYAIAKYNGMVWECHKAGKAISATNLAPSTAYIPYNVVFGVGKATSIKMATANTTYAPVSGKITIYGR